MRPLKFRARHHITGTWRYGFLVKRNGKTFIYQDDGGLMREYQVDPETVGQFTGLTDKNGKEIYEGDILRIVENKNWFSGPDIYEAKYKNGYYEYFTGFVDSEVIGNVHENKDLLDNNN